MPSCLADYPGGGGGVESGPNLGLAVTRQVHSPSVPGGNGLLIHTHSSVTPEEMFKFKHTKQKESTLNAWSK